MVSVLPSRYISGVRNRRPKTPITAPIKRARKKPVEANRVALSTSCWPRRREMLLPAPWPNIKPKAWKIAIRLKTTPMAPEALLPSWPTK